MQLINKLTSYVARLNPKRSAYKFVIKDWMHLPDLDALSRVLESKRFSQNLEPVVMDYPEGKRILVLAPHPDDDIFGAGGVLLKSMRNGAKVKTVCITTGEREDTTNIIGVREEESLRVAELLGSEVEFWRYPARRWRVVEEVKDRLLTVIKVLNPNTLFLPFLADDHEDHRRVNQLYYATCKAMTPHCEIWAYQVYSTVLPNVIVDISDVIERKLTLVKMHQSQMEHRDWAHYIRGQNAFNARWLKTSEPRYAETFFVVPAQEYLEVCRRYFMS